MFQLFFGVALFAVGMLTSLLLQKYIKYTYVKNASLFLGLFLVLLGYVSWSFEYLPLWYVCVGVSLLAICYSASIVMLAKYWGPMGVPYGIKTIPTIYRENLSPDGRGQLVKAVEVLLQDVSAWLIVGGLFAVTPSIAIGIVAFTVIVLLVHIPGMWFFGRIYGTYFLVMSSVLAFMVTYFYQQGDVGFV